MRRTQRVRDLNSQIQHALHRQRSSADQVLQRLPVQKLHGDERLPLVFANLVDRADVGMVERRGGLRLALEPFECLAIARHAVGKKFQGHRTTQARILSFVHNAHSATAQLRDDAVMRDYLAKYRLPVAHKRCMLLSPRQTSISSPKLYCRTVRITSAPCYCGIWSHGCTHKTSNQPGGARRITVVFADSTV